MNRSPPPPTAARGGGGHLPRRGVVPANFRSYREWKPQFTSNHRLDRPPGPYDFTVELRSDAQRFDKADAEAIIAKCKCKLETFEFHCSGSVAASLYFHQWIDALEATVYLWGTRFDGAHSFTPRLVPSRCDMNKLWERLKALFADRVRGLMEGDLVQKWQKKLGFVVDEISGIDASLKKHNGINVFEELSRKKSGLESEKGLTERRIEEFKSAMKCILNHLEGTSPVDCEDEGFEVFRFSRLYDWVRIHSLIRRECRRLEDGLPIYAFRREILQEIYNQQDPVEIFEKTGSAIGPGPLPVISGPLPECNLREFLLIITKFP